MMSVLAVRFIVNLDKMRYKNLSIPPIISINNTICNTFSFSTWWSQDKVFWFDIFIFFGSLTVLLIGIYVFLGNFEIIPEEWYDKFIIIEFKSKKSKARIESFIGFGLDSIFWDYGSRGCKFGSCYACRFGMIENTKSVKLKSSEPSESISLIEDEFTKTCDDKFIIYQATYNYKDYKGKFVGYSEQSFRQIIDYHNYLDYHDFHYYDRLEKEKKVELIKGAIFLMILLGGGGR